MESTLQLLQANREWQDVRRAAFFQDVLGIIRQRPVDLLPFEEVRQRLRLHNTRYRGIQDVPLEQIVGSVGRYKDFTRNFLPRQDGLEDRWQNIDRLISMGRPLPPIELLQVGEAYFVRDGNHRVSVARMRGFPTIQAYVWEYKTRVPLTPDTDMEDLLVKAAYAAFVESTNIDHLYPDVDITLTQVNGYDDLLYEIQALQYGISVIDEREVSFDEAVQLWYEMRYTPIVQIIRQQEILNEFPDHTEADLYLWLQRYQEELRIRYGTQVMVDEAAADLSRRFGEKTGAAHHVKRAIGQLVESVGELRGRLVENTVLDAKAREDDQAAAALLAPIRHAATATPLYRLQGTTHEHRYEDWQIWRDKLSDQLWELLGVGERPWHPWGLEELDPQVESSGEISGVQRELIWLRTEQELYVPLYLLRPQEIKEPLPAVLVFPGHGTIEQTSNLENSYQRANALALARAGFVTLTMELRGFGRLGALGHLQIDAAARLVGRTWYGLLVQDGMRALDYLLTRPEVDPTRIGATGIGAGGALTMYTAALDDRVQAALVNSYLGKYLVTCLDEEHCPCNNIPGILRYAEMGDVAALIGPRPVMFVNGRRDPATSHAAHESFAVVRQVYRLLGVPRRAKLIEPEEVEHYFDNQLAIGWFRRWLSKQNTDRQSG